LKIFSDDPEFGPFLAGLSVLPGIELKSPFNEHRAPFTQVLLRDLGKPIPEDHVNEDGFLMLLAILSPGAIDRQTKLNDWRSLRRVTKFGIAGAISQ
jgi:hypothetical protein